MNSKYIEEYNDIVLLQETEHYCFFGKANSLANEWIDTIIDYQENCYKNIYKVVKQDIDFKINYHFFNNPYDCGRQFKSLNQNALNNCLKEEVNGFAWYPNDIYATFNDHIKCIGHHEDVHIIIYHLYKTIPSAFLCEGLAIFFDDNWQGIDLHSWSKYYFFKHSLADLIELFDDQVFHKDGGFISYPIAGSFCKWFIESYGFSHFMKAYTQNTGYELLNDELKEYLIFIKSFNDEGTVKHLEQSYESLFK